MQLDEILIGRGLVSAANLHTATERQRRTGSPLSDVLVEMHLLTTEQLSAIMKTLAPPKAPAMPRDIADTGIPQPMLLGLMLKLMQIEAIETVAELARSMCLPYQIVRRLMDDAGQRKLVEALGASSGGAIAEIRYTLSQAGRAAAADAASQGLYLGPAPVSLTAYQSQVQKQTITNERLTAERLRECFGGLVVPERYIRKLVPAINAGRSILLFGPPGNGKTTFACRIAELYGDTVYIPHAVEIAGQIMRVFDHGLHRRIEEPETSRSAATSIGSPDVDRRWVACHRPFAMVGGELTLDMLDLQYDPQTRDYTAPLHVKALNGVFLIDDFGRQRMDPRDLLNRWIVPMENRIDFLKMRSGKTFSLPFDDLLIFSTNIEPQDIMDPALLRRIPYKMKLYAPTRAEFVKLFESEAGFRGLDVPGPILDFVVQALTSPGSFGLAYFQPRFICEQVMEACRAFDLEPRLTRELAAEALSNLYLQIEDGRDGTETAAA
jgi:hypothetical protein